VGVRFYSGQATAGEYVAVKRDRENRYDSNAIRVENVMGAQIGHIPRVLAAKLASYLVSFLFRIKPGNGTKYLSRTLTLCS
jgi:SWI/SNF-related matrix-associated actin-dependent regulator of chromatin subfamily A3